MNEHKFFPIFQKGVFRRSRGCDPETFHGFRSPDPHFHSFHAPVNLTFWRLTPPLLASAAVSISYDRYQKSVDGVISKNIEGFRKVKRLNFSKIAEVSFQLFCPKKWIIEVYTNLFEDSKPGPQKFKIPYFRFFGRLVPSHPLFPFSLCSLIC